MVFAPTDEQTHAGRGHDVVLEPVVPATRNAAAIKTETNGKFDLQIFPNNQLGSDTEMLRQAVRSVRHPEKQARRTTRGSVDTRAFAFKTPVDTAGAGDAAHLLPCSRSSEGAQARAGSRGHCRSWRSGRRQVTAVGGSPRNRLTCFDGHAQAPFPQQGAVRPCRARSRATSRQTSRVGPSVTRAAFSKVGGKVQMDRSPWVQGNVRKFLRS